MSAAAIAIIVVVAVVVLVVAAMAVTRRRLQQRFGQEYDRVVAEKRGQLRGAAELTRRERRVQRLRIRPLSAAARAEYAAEWKTVQEGFVDQPQHAVIEGQDLVASVMKERGYPAEDADQITADLSVTHAATLDHYRIARQIGADAERGDASTEDLRQALIHLRAVFRELLGKPDAAVQPDAVTQPDAVQPGAVQPAVVESAVVQPSAVVPRELPATGSQDPGDPGPAPQDAEPPAPRQQLWRPVPVPWARNSDEEEAAQ
jgi:hypothetical protein